MAKSDDPSTPSLAYEAQKADWAKIRAILAGGSAVKAAGEQYLPKYPAESKEEYDRRKEAAPWRPEFKDALRGLGAKPFSKEIALAGTPSDVMKAIAEDVDGRGDNLHNFAADVFDGAVTLGAHGILVDYPTAPTERTRADEAAAGLRPYWVSINFDDILSLRTEQRGGRRVVVYLRIKERELKQEGFSEVLIEKVREITPGAWRTWRKQTDSAGLVEWVSDGEGIFTLDEVPFVLMATSKREGDQFVQPPLNDLADMQIELYRAGSNKEQIYTVAGSPMLTANGMGAPENGAPVETGPGRVLYAPGAEGFTTSWAYIQPDATNLKEIREDLAGIVADMRRLAMQPMLPGSGTITATATGIEAAKAHSALQKWALALKDALEQAFVFTAQWIKAPASAPKVSVNTDFAVGLYGADEVRVLLDARKEVQISQETFWDEMQRRGVLGPQFDREVELARLVAENPPFDPQGELADAEQKVATE